MKNTDAMTLNLSRLEVCDVRMAITAVMISFMDEIGDPTTTPERRKIAIRSLKKWENLKVKIVKQFNEQDAE